MSGFRHSANQVFYNSPKEIADRMYRPRDGSELLANWSLESWGSDVTSGPNYSSSRQGSVPSRLARNRQTIWMSLCPMCSRQGPEWARVVQEPPYSFQAHPVDFYSGKKPFWALVDSYYRWEHREAYNRRFRAGKGIPSKKRTFQQDRELLAASVGNLDWLRYCMKDQKDIRSDRRGFTALHLAVERGNLECVIALVDQYNFPVERTTTKGWTPLHLAINKDNPELSLKCIQYLLKKGAPVNVRNRNGITPLHLASEGGLLECIKVLVEAGADVHALDNQKRKGIDLCKAWNHRDCARFLKDAMWKQDKKDLAEEMGQLKQLKKRLLVMQNKYLLKKKKEKEVQNQVAFTKWLQTKPLSKLPKVKIPKPAPVTKKSTRVTKHCTPVTKQSTPATKQSTPVTKQSTPVTKQSTPVKKQSTPVTKQSTPVKKQSTPVTKQSTPVTTQSSPVTKKSTPVTKKSAPLTKKSTPVTKELPRVKKEPPRVTKEAPHVKKKSPQATKAHPPPRPQPPSKGRPSSTPPARPRFRPLRTQPRNPPAPGVNILPSLSPLIPSRRSPASPPFQSSPGSPRSSPSPPLTATQLRSEGSASGLFRPATLPYLSSSFPPSPRHSSSFHLRPSYPFLPPAPELAPSELELQAAQNLGSSTCPSPEQPLALLDAYLAAIPLPPPPARPSSPSRWTARWNPSTKPEARPATQIAFPQGVRLGVNPDPVQEPDFCDYLKFSPDGEGGVHIQTADGQWIFPVPRLPLRVLIKELCPSRQHERLKVPEGLRRLAIQDLPRRRYAGDQGFWSDSMAMSLRDTFDPAFISLVRMHQGLPPLSPSSPSSPSSSSAPSSIALRQCLAFLFCSLNDPPLIK